MKTHTIDAADKVLGRLASEIAVLLRGKDQPTFAPNVIPEIKIVVKNVGRIKVTGRKFEDKMYFRHSTYPGGARYTPLRKLFERDPRLVLSHAVRGMLPKNKLRERMMKNLAMQK